MVIASFLTPVFCSQIYCGSSARENVLISLLDTDHVSRNEEMPKLSLFQDAHTGSWISCLPLKLGFARGDLSVSSPSQCQFFLLLHRPNCSFKPIEVIFKPEFPSATQAYHNFLDRKLTKTFPGLLPFCLLWGPASDVQLQVHSLVELWTAYQVRNPDFPTICSKWGTLKYICEDIRAWWPAQLCGSGTKSWSGKGRLVKDYKEDRLVIKVWTEHYLTVVLEGLLPICGAGWLLVNAIINAHSIGKQRYAALHRSKLPRKKIFSTIILLFS